MANFWNYWEDKLTLYRRNLRGSNLEIEKQYECYVDGLIAGAHAYSVYKDGNLIVGSMGQTIKDVSDEILKAADIVRDRFNDEITKK